MLLLGFNSSLPQLIWDLKVLLLLLCSAARLRVAANEKAEAEKIIQIKRAEGEAEAKYLEPRLLVYKL